MRRFKRCVLHIGTEKTGTSSIQRFLCTNRQALMECGILYPRSAGKDGGSQWEFVACAHPRPWMSDVGRALGIRSASDQQEYAKGLIRRLTDEFRAAPGADTLVISSEHFHSRLIHAEDIARLRHFLQPWVDAFEVVLYLRRQDRLAVSHYSTKLKSGNPNPEVFPALNKEWIRYYFDYDLIHANWSEVFGRDAMRTRLFDRSEFDRQDLLLDFCHAAAISAQGMVMTPVVNQSVNKRGAAFLRAMNRQLPAMAGIDHQIVRPLIARLVADLCQGHFQPTTRQAAMTFYRQFIAGNERLQARVFPTRATPLFNTDFSDYPEEIQDDAPRYEDAVELAIRLFLVHAGSNQGLPPLAVFRPEDQAELTDLKADNHYLRGMMAAKKGRHRDAIEELSSAIDIKAEHFQAHLALARFLLKDGQYESGLKHLREARRGIPMNNVLLSRLCQRYADQL